MVPQSESGASWQEIYSKTALFLAGKWKHDCMCYKTHVRKSLYIGSRSRLFTWIIQWIILLEWKWVTRTGVSCQMFGDSSLWNLSACLVNFAYFLFCEKILAKILVLWLGAMGLLVIDFLRFLFLYELHYKPTLFSKLFSLQLWLFSLWEAVN